jgi:hypothetical protein
MRNAVASMLVLATTLAYADPEPPPPKKRGDALALSIAGTAGAVGLITLGITGHSDGAVVIGGVTSLVTPAFGEWYAGEYWTRGMTIRTLSAVGLVVSAPAWMCDYNTDGAEPTFCQSHRDLRKPIIGFWIGAYAAGALYDILDAPRAAGRYNRAHAPPIIITPTVVGAPSGSLQYGVSVAGAF